MAHHEEENQTKVEQTVEQLESCIHQEWARIPLTKLQQLISISSLPKRLHFVNKKRSVTKDVHFRQKMQSVIAQKPILTLQVERLAS